MRVAYRTTSFPREPLFRAATWSSIHSRSPARTRTPKASKIGEYRESRSRNLPISRGRETCEAPRSPSASHPCRWIYIFQPTFRVNVWANFPPSDVSDDFQETREQSGNISHSSVLFIRLFAPSDSSYVLEIPCRITFDSHKLPPSLYSFNYLTRARVNITASQPCGEIRT